MTAQMPQPDAGVDYVMVPKGTFEQHMAKVDICVGTLNGLMAALAQNPMFAGFIPADLRAQIAKLSE